MKGTKLIQKAPEAALGAARAIQGDLLALSRDAAALGALEAIKSLTEKGVPKPGTLKRWAALMGKRAFPVLLLALLLSGCTPHVNTCFTADKEYGFFWVDGLDRRIFYCVPCSQAKDPQARFVCFGEGCFNGCK